MNARHTFLTLDLLRGIAALAVVAWHGPDRTASRWLPGSYLAVDFFFILSGFVLAYAYSGRLNSGVKPGAFMRARITRLYPLYLIGTLLGFAVSLCSPEPSALILLAALLFIPLLRPYTSDGLDAFPLNIPSWSMFWELAINLAWALLAPRLTRRLLLWIILIAVAMLIMTAVWFGSLDAGAYSGNFMGGGGRVLFSFFMGVLLHRMWLQTRAATKLVPLSLLPCVLIAVFVVRVAPEWRATYDVVAVIFVFPALVWCALHCEVPRRFGWAARWLGAISYPLYIIHVPVLRWLDWSTGLQWWRLGKSGLFAFLVIAIATAALLDVFYDRPVRAWLTKVRPRLGLS